MTSPDKIKDWKKELRYLPQLYKGSKADILAIESFISSLLQARNREIREKIQRDLDNGMFGRICSNETTFKKYIITTLTREDK